METAIERRLTVSSIRMILLYVLHCMLTLQPRTRNVDTFRPSVPYYVRRYLCTIERSYQLGQQVARPRIEADDNVSAGAPHEISIHRSGSGGRAWYFPRAASGDDP